MSTKVIVSQECGEMVKGYRLGGCSEIDGRCWMLTRSPCRHLTRWPGSNHSVEATGQVVQVGTVDGYVIWYNWFSSLPSCSYLTARDRVLPIGTFGECNYNRPCPLTNSTGNIACP